MADIQSGQTFSPGDEVTDTKLNNMVGAATILPAFLTGKSALALNGADGASDQLLIYDASSGVFKKVTPNDLFFNSDALLFSRSADATPDKADLLLTYDVSAGALKKVTLLDLLIGDAFTAPDTADSIPIYDASGAILKSITIGNLLYYLPVHSSPVGGDRMMIFDSNAGALKHVLVDGLIHGAPLLAVPPADADEFILYDADVATYKKVTAQKLRAFTQAGLASATKTDTFTSAVAGAWTDITGLSVAVTPQNTGSKVLVRATINGASDSNCWLRLVRDATPIGVGASAGSRSQVGSANLYSSAGAGNMIFSACMEFLDSPASAASITYKVQFYLGAGNFYLNRTKDDTDSAATGRSSSTITVMEVAQ